MKRSVAVLALVAASCATVPQAEPARESAPAEPGFDLTVLDRTTDPCDDFYQYATGGWRAANPLPATYARYGRFEELADRNRETLRDILETAAAAEAQPGTATRTLGDFWSTCMDEEALEAFGAAPIRGDLDRIAAISSRAEVVEEIHRQQLAGISPVFDFSAQHDFRNSRNIIAHIAQGGLGLPDREYYLRDEESFRTIRRQYVAHIARMLELAGSSPSAAANDAKRVLALETQLARASMPRTDLRRPENVYHLTPISELQTIAPLFEWPSFFRALGRDDLRAVNVAQPEYIQTASRLLSRESLDTWKAYLRWKLIDAAAPALSSAFIEQDFAFRGRILSGQQELQPRWQRCVRAADRHLGEILGREYVRRGFSPEAKRKMNSLIDHLMAATREQIPTLTWMGGETKRAALAKLEAFRRRIGHPDEWPDVSSLQIGRASHAENVFAARTFAVTQAAARAGKPHDPNHWGLFTPSTVNAGYHPARNDMTFPAGILQPPFFDPNADDAFNYGGIGTVIGHEITHAFDDQGAKFDARGNVRDWWTAEDRAGFHERASCIARQYAAWQFEEDLNLQGELVTGEAIADLGGVTLALRAYRKALADSGGRTIDGFAPEQRFFLGFARVWGENIAAEEARRRLLVDPHAPAAARVNLTLMNMPEFAEAWNCPRTAPMTLPEDERCEVW